MVIFDWLNQITYEKKDWKSFTEDQQASFNSYMVSRFLSMYEGYIDITNVVQNEIEEKELNEVIETVAESLEDEMVDISEETYPIKNQVQNKKGWLKTILFL